MRTTTIVLILVTFACLLPAQAEAGDRLSVRLVAASNKGQDNSLGLEDVVPALSKNFVFESYRLVGQVSMQLPVVRREIELDRYRVICVGEQSDLKITVYDKKRKVMKTSVRLIDGKPLVLGGFPRKNATMILVFTAK